MAVTVGNTNYPAGDAVAIIGAGCRLPGAEGVSQFWDLLVAEQDTVTEIPEDRFDARSWYSPEKGKPDTIRSLCGGFLDLIDHFDANFFGIAPAEAEQMDPQQRMLLEVAWHAIEDAGLTAAGLAGSNTGVYASIFNSGYWDLLRLAGRHGMHAAMGGEAGGMAAGRIAYHLDLHGPAMGVEGTCATSLLAVHVAARALRFGEIDQAIVGGSNLLISPDMHLALSEADMLSGRCRFGDQAADGYVRSEGAVALVLKRLSDAVRDGDRVYATILGSAARSDGRSGGSQTSPGVASQVELLRAAYQDAGVAPAEVDFVEAHGPGTPVGDPVELAALATVLGPDRDPARPCLIGSAKSNIGHLEVAAGLVGLLKAALALHHRRVPATLHVRRPLELFAEPGYPLRLATRSEPLVRRDRPAVAGVSAFGLSGANAHVVLGESPSLSTADPAGRPAYLLPVSAREPAALRELAGDLADLIEARDTVPLADLAHSAGVRRTHHEVRAAVVGRDRRELIAGLSALAAGAGGMEGRAVGDAPVTGRPRIVFVFPGQGSQWAGMGAELLRTDRTFAATLAECDAAVCAELGWSPIAELLSGRELSTVDRLQPVLWAVEVALAATWRAWGVTPDLVIGHSMGEIAAAVTGGALTTAEGAAVICRRARLLAGQRTPGAMWAVELAEPEADRAIAGHRDRVRVGVINGPRSVVLSGDPAALEEIVAGLRERGVFCGRVQVDYASHAPQVEPLSPLVATELAGLRPRAGTVPLHSTVTDQVVDGAGLDGRYWADNLRLPVKFGAAVRSVLAAGEPALFVEISPHPVLRSAIEDAIEAAGTRAAVVGSLRRAEPELTAMLDGLATAYALGVDPDWARLTEGGKFVPLPSYPWQGRRFWVDDNASDATLPGRSVIALPKPAQRHRTVAQAIPRRRLESLNSPADCAAEVLRRSSQLLGIALDDAHLSVSLIKLGMDSLFAGKLAYQLRSELDIQLSLRELLRARSIRELGYQIYGRLGNRLDAESVG